MRPMETTQDRAERYIKQRIANLLEEGNKCKDEYDKMWYNRAAQELEWALEVLIDDKRGECVIDAMVQQDLF